MGRAALTFAEIFIVLGLVFFVQTIANFSLYDSNSPMPPPEFELLAIRQVPTNADDTDHVRYIRFSSLETTLHVQISSRSGLWENQIGYSIDQHGYCESRPPLAVTSINRWFDTTNRDLFVSQLYESFGIAMRMVKVSGIQPEYIFTWRPSDLPEAATITIAVEHCYNPTTEEHLKVDPGWELGTHPLSYPHPIVVDRMSFRDQIDKSEPQLYFAHRSSFPDEPLGVIEGPQWTGLAIRDRHLNCDLGQLTSRNIRSNALQEFEIELQVDHL